MNADPARTGAHAAGAGAAPPLAPPAQPASKPAPRAWRWLGWALAAVALAGVFFSYLSPHLTVDLASRVWACF